MPVARSVKSHEIDEAVDVALAAFQVEPGDEDAWRGGWHRHVARYSLDTILVVEEGGRLISSMVLHPQPVWMGQTTIPSGAVAGVGTLPDARRIGGAAAMLTETVHRLRSWGVACSPMWPFSFAYYRKFGWEIGGEVRETNWERGLEFQVEPKGVVATATESDLPDIAGVWDAVSPGFRCSTAREPLDWHRRLRPEEFGGAVDRKAALVCREGGQTTGYAFCAAPKPSESASEPEAVSVEEIRALKPTAEIALLQSIAERYPEHERFRAAFPANHRLRSLAVNPRAIEVNLACSFGWRITDPTAIFPLMRGNGETLTLRVADKIVGVKAWRLTLNPEGGGFEPWEKDADLQCSIETFSQMSSGYLKPREAARAGLLVGTPAAVEVLQNATAHWEAPYRSGLEAG